MIALSNDTSLVNGDAALLVCVGYGESSVEVTWARNGRTIINTSLISIYQEETVIGNRVFTQSFAQLCSVGLADAGSYTCVVSSGEVSVSSSVEVTVAGKKVMTMVG